MEHPENLNCLFFCSVGNYVRGADNHQFTGSLYPARTTLVAVVKQPGHLVFDFVTLLNGGNRIVLGDVVNDLIKIIQRLGKPLQPHNAVLPARLASV